MADDKEKATQLATARAKTLKDAEDRVSSFLNGGSCSLTTHPAATELEKLIMFKQLRLDMTHQGTQLHDLEASIGKLLKAVT